MSFCMFCLCLLLMPSLSPAVADAVAAGAAGAACGASDGVGGSACWCRSGKLELA